MPCAGDFVSSSLRKPDGDAFRSYALLRCVRGKIIARKRDADDGMRSEQGAGSAQTAFDLADVPSGCSDPVEHFDDREAWNPVV
ncbi:hypothetical protein JCM8202v2_000038 [Rhodotorula sphaerocarpa]